MLLVPAGIEPVKVTVFPPAEAVMPPQVELAFGVDAITIPVGKVSMSGALKVARLVFGLDSVMVRVDIPPALIETGLKALLSVGVPGSGDSEHTEMLLLFSVTAPVNARALPDRMTPVFRVMLVFATMVPTKLVPVPRVAELPTCQNTLQACPPLIRTTDEPLAVVSVLAGIWNIQTALGSFWASSVRVPVNPIDDPEQ